MCKYYHLKLSSEPNKIGFIGGKTPVILFEDGNKDKDFLESWSKNVILNDNDSFNYIREKLLHAHCALEKGALLNDIMYFRPYLPSCPFIVSEKAHGIFTRYKLPTHCFFEIFIQGEFVIKYYLMYIQTFDYESIDFTKSLCYQGLRVAKDKRVYHSVESKKEYLDLPSKLNQWEIIALNESFDRTLDLFDLRITSTPFISEPLAEELEKSNCTALNLLPAFGNVLWEKIK